MKTIQFIGLIICAALLASCETTQTTGGLQETKRLAALQELRQQPQPDESHKNLWSAGQDIQDRDGNPLAGR